MSTLPAFAAARVRACTGVHPAHVFRGDGLVLAAASLPPWVTGRVDPLGDDAGRLVLWPKWWAWPLLTLGWACEAVRTAR